MRDRLKKKKLLNTAVTLTFNQSRRKYEQVKLGE